MQYEITFGIPIWEEDFAFTYRVVTKVKRIFLLPEIKLILLAN